MPGTSSFDPQPQLNNFRGQAGILPQLSGGTGLGEVIEYVLSLPGGSLAQVFGEDIASGNVDLYTVPTGMRAIALFAAFNSAGTTTTYFPQVKIGSTYYRIAPNLTPATLGNGSVNFGYIYEAGETIAVNTSQAGLNVMLGILLFPNTNALKTVKLFSGIASGNNILYKVPTNKKACIFGFNTFANSSGSAGVTFVNATGGTVTYKLYYVPKADVNPSTANQMAQASVANLASTGGSINAIAMSPGDSIQFTSGVATTGQFAFVTVIER